MPSLFLYLDNTFFITSFERQLKRGIIHFYGGTKYNAKEIIQLKLFFKKITISGFNAWNLIAIASGGQFSAAQNDLVSVHGIHHHFHEINKYSVKICCIHKFC